MMEAWVRTALGAMDRRRYAARRSSRDSTSTPCVASDSRMVSAMPSPIQSMFCDADSLKNGSTRTVSARATPQRSWPRTKNGSRCIWSQFSSSPKGAKTKLPAAIRLVGVHDQFHVGAAEVDFLDVIFAIAVAIAHRSRGVLAVRGFHLHRGLAHLFAFLDHYFLVLQLQSVVSRLQFRSADYGRFVQRNGV